MIALAKYLNGHNIDDTGHDNHAENENFRLTTLSKAVLTGEVSSVKVLLDAGANLAISTDWNPGSAPMGDLLVQASLLGIYEKLSSAELLAGITFRAAKALGLSDRGRLSVGFQADMIAFPVKDYRDVFYNQGRVKPSMVWKKGILQ